MLGLPGTRIPMFRQFTKLLRRLNYANVYEIEIHESESLFFLINEVIQKFHTSGQ
jgi:hypothetical protein